MTGPLTSDGKLYVVIQVDGSRAGREFRDNLARMSGETRNDQERVGRDLNNHIRNGFNKAGGFDNLGRVVSSRVASGILGSRRRFRRVGTSIMAHIAEGLVQEGNLFSQVLGGILTTAQQTIGPALGSIFNVSGRSPVLLIGMVVLIGGLISLVLGLLHGLQAVAALLATIPNLLFAIGLQAGALVFIFNGFFEAVGNLAAANSIQELNEALKDTNPAMAAVIKTLFPFKKLFKDISEASKTSFFGAIGDTFSRLYVALTTTNSLMQAMTTVAGGLGRMVATVLDYFTTSEFNTFLKDMADATARWLDGFGPALNNFIAGLTRFGQATLPYVEWFGEKFNNWISSIGRWFDRMANPGTGFLDWLERSKTTLKLFLRLLGTIWKSIKIFIRNIEKAGGDKLLEKMIRGFEIINDIFQSDFGKSAMMGLIRLTFGLLVLAGLLVVGFADFLALFNEIWEFVKFTYEGFVLIARGIRNFFEGIENFLWDWFWRLAYGFINWVHGVGDDISGFINSIPDMIRDAFADAGTLLVDAGKRLIQGLINGALDRLPGLGGAIKAGLNKLGLGFVYGGGGGDEAGGGGGGEAGGGGFSAANLGLKAIQGPSNTVANNNKSTNVNMAAGAVQIGFNSVNPATPQQAAAAGTAAANAWQQQTTKLAVSSVRTI